MLAEGALITTAIATIAAWLPSVLRFAGASEATTQVATRHARDLAEVVIDAVRILLSGGEPLVVTRASQLDVGGLLVEAELRDQERARRAELHTLPPPPEETPTQPIEELTEDQQRPYGDDL